MLRLTALTAVLALSQVGCSLLPERVCHQEIYNPFPQLHKIAVVPFFNHSDEPTVDGEEFALAYYRQLQEIPGFEVVPVEITRQVIAQQRLTLSTNAEFRRLAQALNVDAVVAGSVTEFSPYYPPRLGLAVAWHAADPSLAPAPPGYGLPLAARHAKGISPRTRLEAEFVHARQHFLRQAEPTIPIANQAAAVQYVEPRPFRQEEALPELLPRPSQGNNPGELAAPETVQPAPEATPYRSDPPAWRVATFPHNDPVLTHVRIFQGDDPAFLAELGDYYQCRQPPGAGGLEAHLQRSDEFVAFCCRLHIHEMLAARGGAGKSRVLWKWPSGR